MLLRWKPCLLTLEFPLTLETYFPWNKIHSLGLEKYFHPYKINQPGYEGSEPITANTFWTNIKPPKHKTAAQIAFGDTSSLTMLSVTDPQTSIPFLPAVYLASSLLPSWKVSQSVTRRASVFVHLLTPWDSCKGKDFIHHFLLQSLVLAHSKLNRGLLKEWMNDGRLLFSKFPPYSFMLSSPLSTHP